jgi:heme-degrading monooxygenase HmoA
VVGRVWKGQTRASDVDAYRAYIRETGLADYQRTPGNRGAFLLTSVNGDVAEIVTISFWDSREAIVAFAGQDISVARFYPEDERYLIAADPHATHYEVDA